MKLRASGGRGKSKNDGAAARLSIARTKLGRGERCSRGRRQAHNAEADRRGRDGEGRRATARGARISTAMCSRGRQAHTAAQRSAVGAAAAGRLTWPVLRRNPSALRVAACTRCAERAYSQWAQSERARWARSAQAHDISYAGVGCDAPRCRCVGGVALQGIRACTALMLRA